MWHCYAERFYQSDYRESNSAKMQFAAFRGVLESVNQITALCLGRNNLKSGWTLAVCYGKCTESCLEGESPSFQLDYAFY